MESFYIAETLKYLYLLFDPDHWLFTEKSPTLIEVDGKGQCVMDQGGWVFNTEAHPIDPSALECCTKVIPDEPFELDLNQLLGDQLLFNQNDNEDEPLDIT